MPAAVPACCARCRCGADIKGREQILEVHFKSIPRGRDVDLHVRALPRRCGLRAGVAGCTSRQCDVDGCVGSEVHAR